MSGGSAESGRPDTSGMRSTSGSSIPSYGNAVAPPQSGGGAGGRRAVRGYQFRRNQLHKTKSKTTVSDQDTSELQQSWGHSEVTGGQGIMQETPPPAPPKPATITMETPPPVHGAGAYSSISPLHSGLRVNSTLPLVRHRSVKETLTNSLQPERGKTRPLSAIESHSTTPLVPGPAHKPQLNFRTDSPIGEPSLFTTVTTLAPGGEEGVFREVNIEEAIARSQGNILSCQDYSQEDNHPRARRHVSTCNMPLAF